MSGQASRSALRPGEYDETGTMIQGLVIFAICRRRVVLESAAAFIPYSVSSDCSIAATSQHGSSEARPGLLGSALADGAGR